MSVFSLPSLSQCHREFSKGEGILKESAVSLPSLSQCHREFSKCESLRVSVSRAQPRVNCVCCVTHWQ